MTQRTIWLVLVSALIGGCASHQTGVSGYEKTEPSAFENSPPAIDFGGAFASLIIKRDIGLQGAALPANFHLDGLFLADIKEGRYLELKVRPGPHTLLLKTRGLGLATFHHELQIDVTKGSVKYVRIRPGWPRGMQLTESTE